MATSSSDIAQLNDIPHIISNHSNNADTGNSLIMDALAAIRKHLDMEVAFVAEFSSGHRHFRYVDAISEDLPIMVGKSDPLEETYCQRVVDGRLPALMPDAWDIPAALELPITTTLPVRAHLSVPIHFSNGKTYGTFCCFSTKPDPSLDDRDIGLVRSFAEFTAKHLERVAIGEVTRQLMAQRIKQIIETDSFSIVYQPIYNFENNRISGFESLTRFSIQPYQSPDILFGEASIVGLSEELETATILKAVNILRFIPEEFYISINISPRNIINHLLSKILKVVPIHRIVVEVTEQTVVSDYIILREILDPLRQDGLRFAVDDAGAGFASFRHIVELDPDIIKLDTSLTRNIDTNPKLQALASSMVGFAKYTGAKVVAEGVETIKELETLRKIGINKAQGYLLGRPMDSSQVMDLINYTNEYSARCSIAI